MANLTTNNLFTESVRRQLAPGMTEIFESKVLSWRLFQWEDQLLYWLHPLAGGNNFSEAELASVDYLVGIMRGETDVEPLTVEEISNPNWLSATTDIVAMRGRLARTIYFCLNRNNTTMALLLRQAFDPLVLQSEQLIDELRPLVILFYNVLCVYYFSLFPKPITYFIFESSHVIILIKSGFNWEEAIRSITDSWISFDERRVYCLELAASLSGNQTPLGSDITGTVQTVKYWIDTFRNYSHGEFDGLGLVNFLADENYFGGSGRKDKEIISQIIHLYTHLVDGYLAVPKGDLSALDKSIEVMTGKNEDTILFDYFDSKGAFDGAKEAPALAENANLSISNPVKIVKPDLSQKFSLSLSDVRKIIVNEFGYSLDNQYDNVEVVLQRLQELAIDFEMPEIADCYYFDESTGKFKWKE